MSQARSLLITLGLLAGCTANPHTQDPISSRQDPLFGAVRFGADCNANHREFLNKSMRYGRTFASSAAFYQCVDSVARTRNKSLNLGPYRACHGEFDPFAGSDITTQVARAVEAVRSSVDVTIDCTGGSGGGYASATVRPYGTVSPETMRFSEIINYLSDPALPMYPICDASNLPNCRTEPPPWPFSQGAGIIWHEASHQQGYTHGGNNEAMAQIACGYAGMEWNFSNSMPFILGECMRAVITRSGMRCGTPLESGGGLKVIRGFNDTTCDILRDPHEPVVSWQELGTLSNATKIAACASGRIYALNSDGGIIVSSTGANGTWMPVTGMPTAREITCANDQLYVFDTNRRLWRNVGSDTSVIFNYVGNPGGANRIAGSTISYWLSSASVLYALNDDRSLFRSETGADGSWRFVGYPMSADRIAVGGNFYDARPFALNDDRSLWLNAGDGCDSYWHRLTEVAGSTGIMEISAGNMNQLYALRSDHKLYRGTISNADYLVPTAFGQTRICNGTTLVAP